MDQRHKWSHDFATGASSYVCSACGVRKPDALADMDAADGLYEACPGVRPAAEPPAAEPAALIPPPLAPERVAELRRAIELADAGGGFGAAGMIILSTHELRLLLDCHDRTT